jgi:small-conductance mechanosensitive channel
MASVSSFPLAAAFPSFLATRALAEFSFDFSQIGGTVWAWLGPILLTAGALVGGVVLQWILLTLVRSVARRTAITWDDKVADMLPGPARMLFTLLVMRLFLPVLGLGEAEEETIALFIRVLFITAGTWLVLRGITLGADIAYVVLTRDVEQDSLRRSIHTRIVVPAGIVRFIVILVGLALVCLQFEVVRNIGVSLIASAGLGAVILGLAAQKTIGNLLAGLQVAFTQPVKIGDVVIVENEWGWIETIGLTYVVVKVWDERRLIVPVSYFLDKAFQNWTRESSDLLGTIFVYADYTVPVDAVREELKRILDGTDLWDGRAQGVQVTNLTDRTVELRALVSARSGSSLWDLRCLVREKLLSWLQTQGRSHLPVARVEMHPDGKGQEALR